MNFETLGVPSTVAGIFAIIVVMKYVVKPVIKKKELYPILTFVVALVIAAIQAGASWTNVGAFFKSTFSQMWILGASAMASYDIVVEKIENFLKTKKKG